MKKPSTPNKLKIIVVMPAYNAASTVERTYRDIPLNLVQKVILVDDKSRDDTVAVAKRLGIDVYIHKKNLGYGGNQKTCYQRALKKGADIVVMLHPDYQYDPKHIPALVAPLIDGKADLVLGSRLLNGGAIKGGMPKYKYLANRFLTMVENVAFRTHLSEFHTGFRAYSRRLLESIPFEHNSNDFVFDSEVIAQTVLFDFPIAEIAVPTRYFPEASSINFQRSIRYGFATLVVVVKFVLCRNKILRSAQFNVERSKI